MAHHFPSGQPNHRSGGGIFAFLGARNLRPTVPFPTRSTPVRSRQRVQDILPTSMRAYASSNDKFATGTKSRLRIPTTAVTRSQQQDVDDPISNLGDVLGLPSELLAEIMSYVFDDPKTLTSVRATCKLFEQTTHSDFCRLHISTLENISNSKALERLVWTSQILSLAPFVRCITIDFHNTPLRLSSILQLSESLDSASTDYIDQSPLTLALANLKQFGHGLSLRVKISKRPSDKHSSVNVVMYVILCYVLFSTPDALPLQTLILDFETPEMTDMYHDDLGERYKPVWDRMLKSSSLQEIQIAFTNPDDLEPCHFNMNIKRSQDGLQVSMHCLDDCHQIAMGSMNIFHGLHSLEIHLSSIIVYALTSLAAQPGLKHLSLHDSCLSSSSAVSMPPHAQVMPTRWPVMLEYIARVSSLQSCQLSGLTDWDNTTFQSELWEAEAKYDKTVSKALLQLVKIRRGR